MLKFALVRNIHANGRKIFYDLIIDGVNQFDKFYEDLESSDEKDFQSIVTFVGLISEGIMLPNKQCRKLQDVDKCFEIKKNNLRMYYTLISGRGYILCFGGMKNDQKSDIKKIGTLRDKLLEAHNNKKIKIYEK